MTSAKERGPALAEWFETMFADQRRLWPVWLAVAFGAGIAVYFALPAEPPLWIGATGVPVAVAAGWLARRRDPMLAACILAGAMAAGFLAAQVRTSQVDGRMLATAIERALFVGVVDQIELLPAGQRVTLRDVDIKDLAHAATPSRIRIRTVVAQPELRIGQKVGGVASLNDPFGPAAPGAFDFRRQAFFADLGAVGFGFGRLKILKEPAETRVEDVMIALADRIGATRSAIAQRIRSQLLDATGAIAIALTVGDQTALRTADLNAMRDSGLAHLLSISGLHIAIAAGLFFFGLRFALAFAPWIALRYPVKKWAAVLAILAAGLYAGLAGWTTPTQRSVIMAGIAFLAIILDRSPISLQLVAWAAFLVLLFQPESLLGASFQMSFAAVFALVIVFERLGPWFAARRQAWGEGASWDARLFGALGNVFVWLAATVVTSFIAGLATLPFAVFHFDRLSVFGVVANAIAVPLTAFWIMPAAALALMLMPFGLEGPALQVMGWGCDLLLTVAHWVAGWPGAVAVLPAMPTMALIAVGLGLLWLGMSRGHWRWLGAVAVVAMMATAWIVPRPDILVSPSGKLVAFRSPDNELVLSSNRAERLVRDTWLRRNGQTRFEDIGDLDGTETWLRCNERYCDYAGGQHVRVFLSEPPSASTECGALDLAIVARSIASDACRSEARAIDQSDLIARGAHAIYLKDGEPEIIDAASTVGDRPWAPRAFSSNDSGADQ
ncbi:MAG: ComEC/Rec2 family competence protein [Dongiaceae bacterium]